MWRGIVSRRASAVTPGLRTTGLVAVYSLPLLTAPSGGATQLCRVHGVPGPAKVRNLNIFCGARRFLALVWSLAGYGNAKSPAPPIKVGAIFGERGGRVRHIASGAVECRLDKLALNRPQCLSQR